MSARILLLLLFLLLLMFLRFRLSSVGTVILFANDDGSIVVAAATVLLWMLERRRIMLERRRILGDISGVRATDCRIAGTGSLIARRSAIFTWNQGGEFFDEFLVKKKKKRGQSMDRERQASLYICIAMASDTASPRFSV